MGHRHDWVYQRTITERNTQYYVYRCSTCGQEKREMA